MAITFSIIACRLSENNLSSSERTPILTEDAIALSEKVEQAIQEANEKGSFTIEISEQQLTSYVALSLAGNSQVPVTDLHIRLRDGQIWISGVVHQDNLQLPLTVGVRVSVNEGNNLAFEFSEANIGPFRLPELVLDTITKEVEKAFAEQVANLGEGYRIEELSISEGSVVIRGKKR
ncbi:MAG: LmeA family phospholipid-binding protein [Anaerolineales bacterium]|nr:LmeA family phospholipid-binding protein [Anaerolineales bacterium]